MKHLWEIDHPYYCAEGNFFSTERRLLHDSWAAFVDAWGDSDPDMNLVFRWDWNKADPDDYEPGEALPEDKLLLFFVLQRKADHWSHSIAVTNEDEPAVRAWLTERAKTIAAIWEPISLPTDELAATCTCGTPGLDYEGPQADCPIHGLNEAERLTAAVDGLLAAATRADANGVHVLSTSLIRDHLTTDEVL